MDLLTIASTKTWMAPELVAVNRLPMRATSQSFPTAEEALTMPREQSPWYQSLDGEWSFRFFNRPEEIREDHVSPEHEPKPGEWAILPVPSNWEMHGYGYPHYTNFYMPFDLEPPRVPAENPTGIYRREFVVPRTWKGRRVVIGFGGAESVLYVYVNGKAVGMSKDSRLPVEFDITSHLTANRRNVVAAVVVKWSDASYIEDQDHWWLAGLSRSVYLYCTGPVFLAERLVQGRARSEPCRRDAQGGGPHRISRRAAGRLAYLQPVIRLEKKPAVSEADRGGICNHACRGLRPGGRGGCAQASSGGHGESTEGAAVVGRRAGTLYSGNYPPQAGWDGGGVRGCPGRIPLD